MKYQMVAIDLDGTLFDEHGRVSPANRQALTRAQQAGLMVVLCTGRALNETRPALEQIDLAGPLVLANGAMICDPTTGKTLYRAELEPHLACEIVRFLDGGPHAVLVLMEPEETGLDYLVTQAHRMTDNTRWWFSQIHARIRPLDRPEPQALHHALRVGIVGPSSIMPDLAERVRRRFGRQVFVQHFAAVKREDEPDVHILEIFAAGVNKWAGLHWLASSHGIADRRIAAIGDQINDLEMIRRAGCGIAMANAVQQVQDAADRLTLANHEHGVAYAIEHILAGRW